MELMLYELGSLVEVPHAQGVNSASSVPQTRVCHYLT